MANEFIARLGIIAQNNSTVTGSLTVTNGITGSLQGTAATASYIVTAQTASYWSGSIVNTTSASFSSTASYVNQLRQTVQITGSLVVSSSAVAVSLIGSGSAVFSVDGTSGRLFSVDDSLSGSLFSVNTAAGLPIIEAFSDNTVRIGQFGQKALFISQSRIGIGKETSLNATLDISGSTVATGSITATLGFTGSLFGTATTASYVANAQTASYVVNALTASYVLNAISSSFAITASYIQVAQTASYVQTAQTASYVQTAQTASYITSALTASYVQTAQTASYAITLQGLDATAFITTSSFNPVSTSISSRITNTEVTASTLTTASSSFSSRTTLTEDSSSILWNASSSFSTRITNTEATSSTLTNASASFSTRVTSLTVQTSSYATTGSNRFNGNQEITGSLVTTANITAAGTLTAQTLIVQTITSSVDYVTGSTRFGSSITNTHLFTGSLSVSGSINSVLGFTGSLLGTASYASTALTSSNANTASYVQTAQTASYVLQAVSASYWSGSVTNAATASYVVTALTASYATNATASFIQGGNSFGAAATLGTNDLQNLTLETNNLTRMFVSSSGNIGIGTIFPSDNLNVIGAIKVSYADNGSNIQIQPDFAQVYINANSTNGNFNDKKLVLGSTGLSLRSLGTSTAAVEILSNGNVGIGKITPSSPLDVSGSVLITGSLNVSGGITGSLLGTAATASYVLNAQSASYHSGSGLISNAVSSSYATTSSYADNFTVGNTLTAQRIVVQTISSSIEYASGSNRFGSLLTDTQSMTGSVGITGSLDVNGLTTFNSRLSGLFTANNPSSSLIILSGSTQPSASLGGASAMYVNTIMSASANNQVLVGLDINPSFSTSSFTVPTTNQIGLRVAFGGVNTGLGNYLSIINGGYPVLNSGAGIGLNAQNSGVFYADTGQTQLIGRSLGSNINFSLGNNNVGRFFGTTGNFILQYIGTFTDNGYRLQVNGSGSASGSLYVTGSSSFTGSVNVSGSITSTGTITAQTLVIQTISSSVSYSSGSNIFGSLQTNTHQFTGSVYMSSSLGIGTSALTGISLSVSKDIVGATTSYGIVQNGSVQSPVTTLAFGTLNILNTQAATFTLPNYRHFTAYQGTIGLNSVVTNQYGFIADANLTGATNNYGFYGDIASSANRWNLYMNGTAQNYLAGNLGIGKTIPSTPLDVNGNTTITGSLNVTGSITSTGTITAQTLVVQTISSSIEYASGSNRFGSLLTNTHQFTGSVLMTGSLNVTSGITGSLLGTASYASTALTSSNANTASYVIQAQSASYWSGSVTNAATSSYVVTAQTASYVLQAQSASFATNATGAFIQGGNSFGATATLGTNDLQNLTLETNNLSRLFISASGRVGLGTDTPTGSLDIAFNPSSGSLIMKLASTTTPLDNFTISNATTNTGVFSPLFFYKAATYGYSGGGNQYLGGSYGGGFIASVDDIAYNTGSFAGAAMHFNARNYTNTGALTTRNLFSFGSWLTVYMTMNAAGSVGIGTTIPSYKLEVNGSVAGVGAYNALSDARYKKDIMPINNALDKILSLRGITYNWDKTNTDMNLDDSNHIGLLAQEVELVLPQVVSTANNLNQTKSITYTDIIPVLIESIKELKAELDQLKQKII
jgi:hypothetical protein